MAKSVIDISAAHIANAAVTFTHNWNGATDPSAAQGAAIIADLDALVAKVNSLITALENIGVLAKV